MRANLLRLAWRMLARDWRAGELNVLIAALLLAVASVGTVTIFADRVKGALTREANLLLGADALVSADRTVPPAFAQEAERLGLRTSVAIKFNSMVQKRGGEGAVLADVKAVEAPYPLRGAIVLVDGTAAGAGAAVVPPSGEAWPDLRLAARLGIAPGDEIALGDSVLRVGAIVQQEPEVASGLLAIGPRLLVNLADLPATNLLQPGNRAIYRLYVAAADSATALDRYVQWANATVKPGQRIESVRDLRPEVRQTLERAEQFLGLAALVAVVLAAVAIALAAARYLRRHLDTAATLRCLGAREGQVLALFVVQFLLLGIVASTLGVALSLVGQQALVELLRTLSPTTLPNPGWMPALAAFGCGVLLLLGFGLPPLIALAGAPPLRVLRRDLPRPRPAASIAFGLGAGVLALLVAWQAQDAKAAGIMVGGLAALVLAAAIAAWLVIALLRRLRPGGVTWRFGLANVRRRPLAASLQIGALSLGIMALLLLTTVRGELLENWRASLPPDAPNHFIVNVLPEQVEGVRALLRDAAHQDVPLYPMVRGRLVAVNGQPLDTTRLTEPRARRLAEREFNLSYAATLAPTNRVVAGAWWGDRRGADAGISMERGIAQTLNVKLGDLLTWDIAGAQLSARVTSLRKVDWDSFRPNFFTLFAPGVLEGMPQTFLGAVRVEGAPGKAPWLANLVNRYPNVLAIDVGEIIGQVQRIMDQVARAVEFVFLFTLVGGLLVLQAAIAATQDERQFDAAVLRTLGASQAQLTAAQMAEFVVLGAVSGLLAAAGAAATGYFLADRVFQIPYSFDPWVWVIGIVGGTVCVTVAGWLGTRRTVRVPPLAIIRELS